MLRPYIASDAIALPSSLDHLIRPRQHVRWNCHANLFSRRKANDEFKLRRLLYRQISRFCSLEDPVDVVGGLAVQVIVVYPIGHEAALIDKLLRKVNSRQPVFARKLDVPLCFGKKTWRGSRHNRVNLLLLCGLKGPL